MQWKNCAWEENLKMNSKLNKFCKTDSLDEK